MTIKRTFTQAEVAENERVLKQDTGDYEDGPISDEQSEMMTRLYAQYQQRVNRLKAEQLQQFQADSRALNGGEILPEIGRRK